MWSGWWVMRQCLRYSCPVRVALLQAAFWNHRPAVTPHTGYMNGLCRLPLKLQIKSTMMPIRTYTHHTAPLPHKACWSYMHVPQTHTCTPSSSEVELTCQLNSHYPNTHTLQRIETRVSPAGLSIQPPSPSSRGGGAQLNIQTRKRDKRCKMMTAVTDAYVRTYCVQCSQHWIN